MEEEDKEAEDDLTQMSFKFCNVALTQLIGYDISKTDDKVTSVYAFQCSKLEDIYLFHNDRAELKAKI